MFNLYFLASYKMCSSSITYSLLLKFRVRLEPEPTNLGKKFEMFMKRDKFAQTNRRNTANPSTSNDSYAKIVEKEMQLYKINPIERPKYLELLFKALKTIKPTSVEAERAFSAMGFFVTKLRNRMGDETLDGLITMRKYYQKSKQ